MDFHKFSRSANFSLIASIITSILCIVGSFFQSNGYHDWFLISFESFSDSKEISFSIPELSRILGILLDNAMEATKKCDKPYIRLEMKYDNRIVIEKLNIFGELVIKTDLPDN